MLKQILKIFAVLILAYLVLVHYLGFGKDIAAITNLTTSSAKVFQGR
jgi:hypothetical protein